jgi:hypothetical protein
MHYNLLFNGCSFTYGIELQGIDNNLDKQTKNRFSHLVSEKLNLTYQNISNQGVSNDWIVESTIKWFEEGNTCDIAVIQLTAKARTVWYKNNKAFNFAPGLIVDKKYLKFPILDYFLEHGALDPLRLYYKKVYSDYMGDQNFYKNLFLLENFFKNKKIKIIFLSLCKIPKPNDGWKSLCKTKKIQHIINTGMEGHPIDEDPLDYGLIGNRYTNPENFCPELYQSTKNYDLIGTRPNELGHQKIADYVIEQINIHNQ